MKIQLQNRIKKQVLKNAKICNIESVTISDIVDVPEFEGAMVVNCDVTTEHGIEKYEVILENGKILEINSI